MAFLGYPRHLSTFVKSLFQGLPMFGDVFTK
jgi:hypothetical protein